MQALFKARFEQALESQKLNIKKIEQQLRRMGVNPEDPAAMASIQRVASTFFNAIDKKEGSPYVFHEGKQSFKEPEEDLEQSEHSIDSDQEELDRFIAEIEDAADKEYEAEEAKEQEELGRIRYWNREEFGGRFRRSDVSRNDDHDGEVRGSRFRQTALKHQASDSDDENIEHSDDNEEWNSLDSNSDNSIEAKGRFKVSKVDREKRKNFGRAQVNESSNRHAEGRFRGNAAIVDSESGNTFSDLENAMWESDEEENEPSRQFSNNYKSKSNDKYAYHTKRDTNYGARGQWVSSDDSDHDQDGFDVPKSGRGKEGRVERADTNQRLKSLESGSECIVSDSEEEMWLSDSVEGRRYTRRGSGGKERNVVKNDNNHNRNPKEADEAWDSD